MKLSAATAEGNPSMSEAESTSSNPALRNLDGLLPRLEILYKDVHSHPELSMQETRTAGLAADWLRASGYEVRTPAKLTAAISG